MSTAADPLVVSSPPVVESTTLNELVRKAAVLYSLPAVAAEVLDLMRNLNEREGTAFVFSTHDQRIMSMAGRVLELMDGELQEGQILNR